MLEKPKCVTMGPILLSRSQEDSWKIKKDFRFPAETAVESKLWQKMPNKKWLKFVKENKFGMLRKATYETMGPIILSRSQNDSWAIKKERRFTAETAVEPKSSYSFSVENRMLSRKHKTQNCIIEFKIKMYA